jgi:endonuclease/exonuclease/phosphatase family metal-dependent hydrolase
MRKPFYYFGIFILLSTISFSGCSGSNNSVNENDDEPIPNTEFDAIGTASSLDFATWNLEWFGDISDGPSNEQLQLDNVQFVISGLDMDIWSVQEVVEASHFETLLNELEGYDGFLANDEFVTNGPDFYSDFNNSEQKVGLIYKSDMITVESAKVILTDFDYEFAGRPPVEVSLSATIGDITQDLVVILLHAKCCPENEAWERKAAGSEALKTYLDQTWPDAYVMVIGDFNDDVDTSITSSKNSAYQNFVDDSLNYIFPTKQLSEAGISSTVFYPDVIDHHLTTNELYNLYIENSVISFPADDYVTNYGNTTSDHYPILSQYTLQPGN